MISDTLPVIEWADPYATHPAFATARPSLVLSKNTRVAMAQFDSLYATTERLGSSLAQSLP